MRGKGSAPPRGHPLPGITPAYAGKSNALLNLPAGQRDHPRVCGEKEAAALSEVYETGSPPRMRGKGSDFPPGVSAEGITPAYAGKSEAVHRPHKKGKDHPRVCGEKENRMTLKDYHKGSPPRMRGKGNLLVCYRVVSGITPAYAGKSFFSTTQSRCTQDHPRVCGEKDFKSAHPSQQLGSPPRMRGKD